jgi:hypothetical protein
MNLTYTRPGELRKPDVEVLPDGRIRITRYIAAGHGDRDYSEVTESVGTADKGLATALLVKRGMAQINGKDAIVKTYEVRNASSETLVGLPDVQYTESGQKTMVYDFIQMSSGTYTPGTIGSTQAPDDATCILRTEQTEDDGTTRQIRRVFINKGLLQQSDETRNNGALLLKTFVYLNDAPVPNPPPNYTLISQRTENPNGLETTTYTYAYGTGEISREESTGNNGALLRKTIRYLSTPAIVSNPIGTLVGYTLVDVSYQEAEGHKIWTGVYVQGTGEISSDENISNNGALSKITIRYLSTPLIVANPISAPAAGYILIDSSYQDNDGHKVWTAVYAKGDGEISRDDNTSNNGALLRATIRYLSDPSTTSNPITITGGYTLIDISYQDADGHKIWTGTYAKGVGEISRDIAYSNTSSPGTTGITRTTIRYLVAPAATVQPTTEAGSVEIARSLQEADGHRIWTTVWAKGSGEISRDIRYVQSLDKGVTNGATVITIRHLTAISVNTNPTSEPSYVMISEDKSDQDGYRVWTVVYAKGTGTVVTDVDIRNSGKLRIHHKVALGAAPSTPSPDIVGATMNVVSQNERNDNGYKIYDYTWAEGLGIVSERLQYRDGGLRLLNRDIFLAQGTTDYSAYTPTYGIEVDKSFTEGEGIRRYSVTWIQSNSGGDPLTNPVLQFTSKVPFTYPGRAKAYYIPFTTGSYTSHRAYDVFMSPPIQSLIDATTIVYYKSTNTTPTPSTGYSLWNPTDWAVMQAKWIGWSDSPRSKIEGLRGYIAMNPTVNATALVVGATYTILSVGDTVWTSVGASSNTAGVVFVATGVGSGSGTAIRNSVNGSSTSATDKSVLGDRVFASTSFEIILTGGPADPAGTNKTLNIEQVPAFTKTDGTQYYRVTEVYATIPTQPALPVLLS